MHEYKLMSIVRETASIQAATTVKDNSAAVNLTD
jgi:hypothetical protein